MEDFFTILGGMGTLATESFVRLLNERTPANSDQDYLNYIVVNHASIPDRTGFLLGKVEENPKDKLRGDVLVHTLLRPKFFVIPCNTAHFLYDDLQRSTDIPILHMPRIAVEALAEEYPVTENPRIAFLGTEGSILTKVYEQELKAKGYEYCLPSQSEQEKINFLIYDQIKGQGLLDFRLFREILDNALGGMGCSVAILGCTELSYISEKADFGDWYAVIDAQEETVNRVLKLLGKV